MKYQKAIVVNGGAFHLEGREVWTLCMKPLSARDYGCIQIDGSYSNERQNFDFVDTNIIKGNTFIGFPVDALEMLEEYCDDPPLITLQEFLDFKVKGN